MICFDMLGGLRGSGGSMKSTRSRKDIDDIAFGIHGIPSTPRYYSLCLDIYIFGIHGIPSTPRYYSLCLDIFIYVFGIHGIPSTPR